MNETYDNNFQKKRIEISEKLKNAFSFRYDDFSAPIQWIDDVGLSRVKEYGNQHASIYKFGIVRSEFDKETSTKKKLWVSAGYGKKLSEGISYGAENQSIFDPIEVDFPDQFFYDILTNKFFKGEIEITPQDIINILESAHLKPTKFFRGFNLRCKLFIWRVLIPETIKSLDFISVFLLRLITGAKTEINFLRRGALILLNKKDEIEKEKDKVENEQTKKTEPLSFFGYLANPNAVFLYCFLHLVVYFLYKLFNWDWPILKIMLENNFLVTCYVIVTLPIIDKFIPRILRGYIYNYAPRIYISATGKRLKI